MSGFILRFEAEEREHRFERNDVVLGSSTEALIPLNIATEDLEKEHLRISRADDSFVVRNVANDPFVTLNGKPFGRKKIQTGDTLVLGGTLLVFEAAAASSSVGLECVEERLEKKLHSSQAVDDDIDALIREVESFDEAPVEVTVPQESDETSGDAEAGRSFQAVPLHTHFELCEERVARETIEHQADVDDVSEDARPLSERVAKKVKNSAFPPEGQRAIRNHFGTPESVTSAVWRPLVALLIVLLAVLAATGSGLYFTFSEKSDEQEYIAAQGLADIGMALTRAQLYQVKPNNLNWASPEFLKENIKPLIPDGYSSLIDVDSQGVFADCPYILRVYTSGDMSQYLLVAQPDPSFWQWLIARETIVLDSRTMELRKTAEIRALNRLLAHPTPLEGANALEVSQLVAQAELLRPTTLATETQHREFSPPLDLAVVQPGAELRVYNMPRYHRLTSDLMKAVTAIDGADDPEAQAQEREFKQDLQRLSQLPYLVYYTTSTDDQETAQARELLHDWLGDDRPLIAYLEVEQDSGGIVTSYMLDEAPPVQETPLLSGAILPESHPLLKKFKVAAAERRNQLAPLTERIVGLIDQQQVLPRKGFFADITSQIDLFEELELDQETEIRQLLVEGYRQYVLDDASVSLREFIDYAQQAGLGTFLPDEFSQEDLTPVDEAEEAIDLDVFGKQLLAIQQAETLGGILDGIEETHATVAKASEGTQVALGNQLQLATVRQLDFLLFSPQSPLQDVTFDVEGRGVLQQIFQQAGIDDTEQLDYYLSEYDLRQQ